MITKAEQKKLKSLEKRAIKVAKDATKVAFDTRKELKKQMERS